MKVLHVINYLSDGGGAEKLMEELLPQMKMNGVDVSVAVLRSMDTQNSRNIIRSGVKIIPIGTGNRLYSPVKMLRLSRIMRDYDIVHSHLTAPFLSCAFNKFFTKARLVYTLHNTDTRFRHSIFGSYLEKLVLGLYDSVICCSREAELALRSFLGNNKINICTINNGINLAKFQHAGTCEELEKYDCRKIVMVAVFRAQKDHETLINAIKLLPRKYQAFFVGYGERMIEMQRLSYSLNLSDRVHFLGKRTDVPQILKSADFIVLSSHYEGLSLSSIEAMSVGKPFIASDVPGLHELVKGYGVLFDEGNADQLAKEIVSLDKNLERYRDVCAKCLSRSADYDIKQMAEKYMRLYNSLLESVVDDNTSVNCYR